MMTSDFIRMEGKGAEGLCLAASAGVDVINQPLQNIIYFNEGL